MPAEDPLRRAALDGDATAPAGGAGRTVPAQVRVIAWLYLVLSALGLVGGVVELVQGLRAGELTLELSLALGLSGWAIGQGLLKGSRTAWRWARGVAALALPVSLLIMAVAVLAPANAEFSGPWGSRPLEPGDPLILGTTLALTLFWAWQLVALSRPAVRAAFTGGGEEVGAEEVGAEEVEQGEVEPGS